jgi:hypothetical protein
MRIGTWNVEGARGRRNPDRLKILRAGKADVWVLTETHPDLDLSDPYSQVSSEPLQLTKAGFRWVSIWSHFPLVRTLPVPDPRRMVAAVFDTRTGALAVAGVVLPWHSDRGDVASDPPPRNWQEHRRVVRNEVPALLKGLRLGAPDARRVVAGDFNTDLARPHSYGLIAERRELTRLVAEESLVCHTAGERYPKPSPVRNLIDHVCTSWGPAEAVETWTGIDGGRPRLSDHPGVVVTLPD